MISIYNKHKETVQNFSWRSLQMFSRYGVTAIIFFAAAKLLSPEDFGLLNYLRTMFFLLMIFCDFGVSFAISKFVTEYKVKQSERLNSITFTIVVFSLSIAALISAAVIIFGNAIFKENYRYILCFLPSLFLLPLTNIFDGVYRGLKDFKKLAFISSIVGLVSIGISIFLINSYLLIGAIWSMNIMYLLLFLSLCCFQKSFSFHFDRSVLVEVIKYAMILGIGAVTGYLYTRASILILGQFGYVVEVGYYGLIDGVFQLLFLPYGMLGQVIAPNTTSHIATGNIAEVKNKVKKYAAVCAITGVVLSIILYFGLPVIIKTFFPKYNTSSFILIMNILILLVPFSVWTALFNQGFVVPAGLARMCVIISLIGGVLNVILDYIFIGLFGFVAIFWIMVGLISAITLITTVYFYIKINALDN